MNLKKAFIAAAVASVCTLAAHATLSWETGDYDPATWQPSEGNILAELTTGTFTGTYYTENGKPMTNKPETLVDGVVPGATMDYSKVMGVKSSGSTVSWTFGRANISEVKIFSRWGDGGRDGIAISKVEVMDADQNWIDIGAPAVSYGLGNNNKSSGHLYARLVNDAGAVASGAYGIRLTFGAQDNTGAGYVEIEAVAAGRSINSVDLTQNAAGALVASLGIDAGETDDDQLLVLAGEEDLGTTLTGWTVVETIPLSAGQTQVAPAPFAGVGTTANIYRFALVPGNGDDPRFSDPIATPAEPQASFEVSSESDAVFTGTVAYCGRGCGTVDVYIAFGPKGAMGDYALVAGGLTMGDEWSKTYTGLEKGVVYDYSVKYITATSEVVSGVQSLASGKWTYSGGTMTDGDWVLNATLSGTKLSITGVNAAGVSPALCLGCKVVDASSGAEYSIVGIGGFSGNTAITTALLPDTLTTVAQDAFKNCTALTTVCPFLPDSVTSIGIAAFSGCSALACDLRIGFNAKTTLETDRFANASHFSNSGITGLSIGGGISSILGSVFSGCTELVRVELPASSITSLGASCFSGCSKLETITPFLPDSIKTISEYAFNGCPLLKGTLRLGFADSLTLGYDRFGSGRQFLGTAIDKIVFGDATTAIPEGFANGCTSLGEVVLSETVTKFGDSAFQGCTSLTNITPLLPDSVTSIGVAAFSGCSQLIGELRLGYNDGVSIPQNKYGTADTFSGAQFTKISLGGGVTDIGKGAFNNDKACHEVVFDCDKPSWNTAAFSGWTNYQARFVVPSRTNGWTAALADSTFMTIVADFAAGEEDRYTSNFDSQYKLMGYTKANPAKQWIAANDVNDSVHSLTVESELGEIGTAFPEYGFRDDVGSSTITCSVSKYARLGTDLYQVRGYVLEDYNAGVFENPVTNYFANGETSFEFTPTINWQRLTWLWGEPVAFEVAIADFPAGLGTVTANTSPDLEGCYTEGSQASFTVADGSAAFVQWMGNIPEEQKKSRTIVIDVDEAKNVVPYFDVGGWTYDSSAKTIFDGYWTLNVTVSGTELTVKSIAAKAVDALEILDLARPVDGGAYSVVGLGGFLNNTALKAVMLPSGLRSFADSAFQGCSSLASVTPLLPDTVTSFGVSAFRDCTSLKGDLRIGYNAGTSIPNDKNGNGYTFSGCAFDSVSIGSGVTSLSRGCFSNNRSMRTLELPATLATIGVEAFSGCTALATITPFLPDSVTYVGEYAFNGCTALTGDLRLAHNAGTTFNVDRFGKSQAFSGTAITSVDVGDGATSLAYGIFENCKALTSVELPDTLTFIGNRAFQGCTALTTVTPFLPDSVTSIGTKDDGPGIFGGCTALTGELRLGFNDGLTTRVDRFNTAGDFQDTAITAVEIGPGLTDIRPYFFANCKALVELKLTVLPTVSANAFSGVANYQMNIRLCREDEAAMNFLADTTKVTPWDGVDQKIKDKFAEEHPGARPPKGVTTAATNMGLQWVFTYSSKSGSLILLR